ncbi:MAG TPA: ABC transporter substrate-binding protein, partial [Actinomycetota bacterium]|nr:ABC transporter substrate-binding protein [Actinomycetota bacterium]
MRRRLIASAALVLLVAASCSDADDEQASEDSFASVRVGLLMTTGGKGGDLAGPSLGAAEVATAHLKARGAKVTIEQADYAGDITTAAQLANELAEKVDVVVVAT